MTAIRRLSPLQEQHARLLADWFSAVSGGDDAGAARIDREIADITARIRQQEKAGNEYEPES